VSSLESRTRLDVKIYRRSRERRWFFYVIVVGIVATAGLLG
jgi:hypothetical protein